MQPLESELNHTPQQCTQLKTMIRNQQRSYVLQYVLYTEAVNILPSIEKEVLNTLNKSYRCARGHEAGHQGQHHIPWDEEEN